MRHRENPALLAAIVAAPDDDAVRLVYADWLEEHGRPAEAELIRVQCELEPFRERYGEVRTDGLLQREEGLLGPLHDRESKWLFKLVQRFDGIRVEFRRGFVDALRLPARWLIEYGSKLRKRYPLLRKLVVFRLNGWGRRLSSCRHLKGIRELDLPCWYGDEDCAGLAQSPHLTDLEALHYWVGRDGNADAQLRPLAGSAAWPNLRALRVVLGEERDRETVNAAAGRPIAELYDPHRGLFPFAADFDPNFFVGRLGGGTPFFASDPGAFCYSPGQLSPEPVVTTAQLFDAAGNPTTTREISFPPGLVYPPAEEPKDFDERWKRDKERRKQREQFLRETIGFEPAFIRVKEFRVDSERGPARADPPDDFGAPDDPSADLKTDYYSPLGFGRSPYGWVMGGEFLFFAGNTWVCDKTGHVVFT